MEPLIRSNTLPSSVAFHNPDPQASPYIYDGFGKLPVSDYNWVDFDPDNSSTDLRTKIYLTLEHHKYGNIRLKWTQAALTVGGGPSFQRFVDFFPYEAIEKIEVRYGSKKIQEIPRAKFYINLYTKKDEKALEKEMELAAGGKSTSERTALALDEQEVEIEIPVYWGVAPKYYLPVHLLETPPTIEIFWRNVSEYIQTDGTGPYTSERSNIQIRAKSFFETDKIKSLEQQMCQGEGIQYLFRDIMSLEGNTFDTSVTIPYQIDVSHFTHENVALYAFIRDREEVEGGPEFYRGMENLLPWDYIALKSGAKFLRDPIYYRDSIYYENEEMLNGPIGTNIIILYLSDNITDETGCYGSKPVGAIISPKFLINPDPDFDPATLGHDLRIDVYAQFNNIITLRYVMENGYQKIKWASVFV